VTVAQREGRVLHADGKNIVKSEQQQDVETEESIGPENDPVEIGKLANIAQIVEIMEETHKQKDWLVDQIKQKRQRIPITPAMSTVGILKMCSVEVVSNMLSSLQSKERYDIDITIPPITKEYHWFFTDIVAASDPTKTTMDQARKIILLNRLIELTDSFKQRETGTTLVLPTGDGMAIGFDDSPEKPLNLAIEVHRGLNRYNSQRKKEDKVELRIGLDSGPVYIIKDLNGNENVWGPGIIMARRVMDLAESMNIVASASFANNVKMLRPEYRNILYPAGNYKIKHHQEPILIYNIYGKDFGRKKPPSQDKTQQSKAAEEVARTSSRFLFNSVELDIDILDIKTMLAHHTLTWSVVNVSKEPIERIFYYLDGDTSRDFPEMNVTVKDEADRELEIMSLNVNKPLHKEFFVKTKKPLKPGEKGRILKLEYNWEEPERMYLYRFASDCKKFAIRITVPKELQIKQKVVRVDTETGEKFYAATPATVKYLGDKTEISWSGSNFRAYDAYRFDW
jgi:class 3 adenylate cyclase